MIIPIIIYFIFLIVFVIFSAIIYYHLNEFGYVGDACRPMMVAYSVTSLTIILLTIISFIVAGGVNA
ncbi:MAG: hypothetical protein ACD_58C00191G0004 [uncultured bacterium]|nr:MAG: hypothetical protein ACD_58C00191G0004 [uncultured bacterium]